MRGIRRKVAEHMVKSRDSTAQVTHVDEVDMTDVVHLREKAKASAEKRGIRITYLPFIIKALVLALKKYPYLNASLDDEKQEIVLKKYYNIGIATDTEQGLVVPVVRAAEHKSITQLAEEISKLSEKARAGQLTLDEIQGSTFTVTNVGGIGGVFADADNQLPRSCNSRRPQNHKTPRRKGQSNCHSRHDVPIRLIRPPCPRRRNGGSIHERHQTVLGRPETASYRDRLESRCRCLRTMVGEYAAAARSCKALMSGFSFRSLFEHAKFG